MPTHLKKDLGNGGDVSQSEQWWNFGVSRKMPDNRVCRGGGKGKVVVDWWYGRVFVM